MQDIIIVGAGGHAKVVICSIHSRGEYHILGATDPNRDLWGKIIIGSTRVLGDDSVLEEYASKNCAAAVGVGISVPMEKRKRIFEILHEKGFMLPPIVHRFTFVCPGSHVGKGAQIMAGSVIQADCYIGKNTIINTCVSVDHGCRIGSHSHIGPGATLGGDVTIGDGSFIGLGARILPGISVGENAIVGGGAVVTEDVPDSSKVFGIPAKLRA
ncbi:MAG: acetyltransferase [Deltaproteobacteria bacterium]|nr:acetyltransferase [Deltaproteobacteria bacterium]MBW2063912.1 acetyltransferase [Deltaproteobacteria bacterium]